MIILTERLQAIADNIGREEKIADIGTDHGYLPLYLYEKYRGSSEKIIMADVSKGSLSKAEENFQRLFPDEYELYKKSPQSKSSVIELRLGDGLDVLDYGEVDTVIMAGIGGLLMIEIMDWDISKTISYKKFILQPRNNGGALRRYLFENGINVEKLLIIPEDKRFCEIMICKTPEKYTGRKDSSHLDDIYFDYPDAFRDILQDEAGDSIMRRNTRSYLENLLATEKSILARIVSGYLEKGVPVDETSTSIRESKVSRLEEILK